MNIRQLYIVFVCVLVSVRQFMKLNADQRKPLESFQKIFSLNSLGLIFHLEANTFCFFFSN